MNPLDDPEVVLKLAESGIIIKPAPKEYNSNIPLYNINPTDYWSFSAYQKLLKELCYNIPNIDENEIVSDLNLELNSEIIEQLYD
jgi:hypothetical protein